MTKFEDFQDLVKDIVFLPTCNTKVKVQIVELPTSSYPVNQCRECTTMLTESGIMEAMSKVKWSLVDTSFYNLLQTVSEI